MYVCHHHWCDMHSLLYACIPIFLLVLTWPCSHTQIHNSGRLLLTHWTAVHECAMTGVSVVCIFFMLIISIVVSIIPMATPKKNCMSGVTWPPMFCEPSQFLAYACTWSSPVCGQNVVFDCFLCFHEWEFSCTVSWQRAFISADCTLHDILHNSTVFREVCWSIGQPFAVPFS